VIAAGLPGIAGVVAKFILLDPDGCVREEVDAAHVIPVGVADDDVGDLVGLDPGEFHGVVGA